MNCEVCGDQINEPYYFEIDVKVVKHDTQYVAPISFTKIERDDLFRTITVHKKCWKTLLHSYKGG